MQLTMVCVFSCYLERIIIYTWQLEMVDIKKLLAMFQIMLKTSKISAYIYIYMWRSRVEYFCRVVYLWCTVCYCPYHLWRALPYSVAPTVCIRLAGGLHIRVLCAIAHGQSV